jgi:hypothetical protein
MQCLIYLARGQIYLFTLKENQTTGMASTYKTFSGKGIVYTSEINVAGYDESGV